MGINCRKWDLGNVAQKKSIAKFCCVVRNHTSLKNIATISIYSLQSKPSLLDQRECSSMNKINLINTMVAYTDHSETHSFSPLALLPLLPFSQPYLSLFSALFQPFVPFLSTFLNVKHPNFRQALPSLSTSNSTLRSLWTVAKTTISAVPRGVNLD